MKRPESVRSLENLGRVRLSKHFFFRDFLYSEVANLLGIPNIPDEPDLAIEAGKHLCLELLEPLKEAFGHVTIRSAYRSATVNQACNEKGYNCANNEKNAAGHIWDLRDKEGHIGAMACIVIPAFLDYYEKTENWQALAWYIHDHLPYSALNFFPSLCAFNIGWHQKPKKIISSFIAPKGTLTKPGMPNHDGEHASEYADALENILRR